VKSVRTQGGLFSAKLTQQSAYLCNWLPEKIVKENRRIRFTKTQPNKKGQNHKQLQSTNEYYQTRADVCSNISYTATADAGGMDEKRLQETANQCALHRQHLLLQWLDRGLGCVSCLILSGIYVLRCKIPFTFDLVLYRT